MQKIGELEVKSEKARLLRKSLIVWLKQKLTKKFNNQFAESFTMVLDALMRDWENPTRIDDPHQLIDPNMIMDNAQYIHELPFDHL